MAAWPSGKAGDCKSPIRGSNPRAASSFETQKRAGMAELVDAVDLKSTEVLTSCRFKSGSRHHKVWAHSSVG